MAVFQVPGPSVPGLAIPGDSTPGYPGAASGSYQFTSQVTLTYLQYLGPGGTLTAVPGQQFAATDIMAASGWSYPLAVPPPDNRWTTGTLVPLYEVVFREPPGATLARARAVNAALQARELARPGEPPSPQPAPVPAPRRAVAPSAGALELAAARLLNIKRQARQAAGGGA